MIFSCTSGKVIAIQIHNKDWDIFDTPKVLRKVFNSGKYENVKDAKKYIKNNLKAILNIRITVSSTSEKEEANNYKLELETYHKQFKIAN
jgi:hypothetical protein